MIIKENIPLAEYTTFKIGGPARFFCEVFTEDDVVKAVRFASEKSVPIFVLGGGSNILISDHGFPGVVIKIELKGIKADGEMIITAAAGEMWDELVEKTIEQDLYGLENLSAIPGTVGAAAVQNIGAYGTEVSQVIQSVRALDIVTMKFVELTNVQCCFTYRDSIFKQEKGRYIVTQVRFRLMKGGKINISYIDLENYFSSKKIVGPSLNEVREAVIEIRWGKLPDWKLWGTAGSYFKNPIVSISDYSALKIKYPELPGYPESDGRVKVSLGWILDKVCKAKGLCVGNAFTYEKQALVVVVKPGATADDVVNLTHELMRRVKDAVGIEVTAEVEWVN